MWRVMMFLEQDKAVGGAFAYLNSWNLRAQKGIVTDQVSAVPRFPCREDEGCTPGPALRSASHQGTSLTGRLVETRPIAGAFRGLLHLLIPTQQA